jgi:hypothetical protein
VSLSVLEVAVVAAPKQLLHNIQTAKPTPDRTAEIKIKFLAVGEKARG